MKHEMKLNPDAFDKIIAGTKTREYRLYDEKRRHIKLGDVIEFQKLPELQDHVLVRVEGLLLYENWYSCYEDFFKQDLSGRYATIEDAVKDTYAHWWPKEKEEKYGCLIIKFKKI